MAHTNAQHSAQQQPLETPGPGYFSNPSADMVQLRNEQMHQMTATDANGEESSDEIQR